MQGLSDIDEAKAKGANFLFDDLRQRGATARPDLTSTWNWPRAGTNWTTSPPWPGRKKVTLGQLRPTMEAEGQGARMGVTFIPTVLPKGVAGNRPVLAARAAPYAISQGRRQSEAVATHF